MVADPIGSTAGEAALLARGDWVLGMLLARADRVLQFSQLGMFLIAMLGSLALLACSGAIAPHNKAPAGCRGS